jgi:hypothetical protein
VSVFHLQQTLLWLNMHALISDMLLRSEREIPMSSVRFATQTANDLQQLHNCLKNVLPSTADAKQLYWFRGHSDIGWDLSPSLLRILKQHSPHPSVDEAVALERDALKTFQAKAHLFVDPSLLAKVHTMPCWWALMQHYGAPTRLLDWTVSPYVAAYFAVQPAPKNADGKNPDGVIWGFCSKTLARHFDTQFGGGRKIPAFDETQAVEWYERELDNLRESDAILPLEFHFVTSERIAAQQGRFTMCFSVLKGEEALLSQIGKSIVYKVTIPSEAKPKILIDLRDMNIRGDALFPGIEGLGRTVAENLSLSTRYANTIRAQEQELDDTPSESMAQSTKTK